MSEKVTRTGVLRFDVWGGDCSCNHVARYHFDLDDPLWLERQRQELRAGFLVNLRMLGSGEGWGSNEDFDARSPMTAGRA